MWESVWFEKKSVVLNIVDWNDFFDRDHCLMDDCLMDGSRGMIGGSRGERTRWQGRLDMRGCYCAGTAMGEDLDTQIISQLQTKRSRPLKDQGPRRLCMVK